MRSKNANLILNCGFRELVTPCTVNCRKIPHFCKDTKWPPRLIFAGACHGQKTGTVTKACDKACGEHVSRPCALAFALLFPLSRCRLRYFWFSALDFCEFKRFQDSIYGNVRELFFEPRNVNTVCCIHQG